MTSGIVPPQSAAPNPGPISFKWLENLYKECGREITLAYTTLNQMKNWAIVIAGAILSGLAFGSAAGTYPTKPMFVGVVIAFAFTLRFFIRAILCYINLSRWNTLQRETLGVMLWASDPQPPASPQLDATKLTELEEKIRNLYFDWHSPISRSDQIASNLKLGFSLLFALCLFFLVWGAAAFVKDHLVQGLLVFVVGSTAVEFRDFLTSRYFDTKEIFEKRKKKPQAVFPRPQVDSVYVWSWLAVLVLSLLISFRDKILSWLCGQP
jgi:hypothetical protein